MLRSCFAIVAVHATSFLPAEAVIDERFEMNPCLEGGTLILPWICRGDAVWVAHDAAPCPADDPGFFTPWSTFDPLGPCTLHAGKGYVLLTPSLPERGGAIYNSQRMEIEGLVLTFEIELRDGPPGDRGDGLAVVLIDSPDPPGLGSRGGGLGALGLGEHPTFICAFRNAPESDREEIVYSWSRSGFPPEGEIPTELPYTGGRVILDRGTLNSGQPHPAPPNIFGFILDFRDGWIRGFVPGGATPVFEVAPEDFNLSSKFVGVTATTSGSYQNSILHRIEFQYPRPPQRFVRGDSTASGEIDISDGVAVLLYGFWLADLPCEDAADTDDNGQINITDGVRVLNWLFLGGPPPPAPGPLDCGDDPTADDLPICVYEWCR